MPILSFLRMQGSCLASCKQYASSLGISGSRQALVAIELTYPAIIIHTQRVSEHQKIIGGQSDVYHIYTHIIHLSVKLCPYITITYHGPLFTATVDAHRERAGSYRARVGIKMASCGRVWQTYASRNFSTNFLGYQRKHLKSQ